MSRRLTLLTTVVAVTACFCSNAAQAQSKGPGLGPAGVLQAIVFEETIEPVMHGCTTCQSKSRTRWRRPAC
jgi:hypothetical protein